MAGWDDSSWNPLNWFSSPPVAGSSGAPQMTGNAPFMTPGQVGTGGFVAPTADDPNTASGQTGVQSNWGNAGFNTGGGGMNWAGLSQGLSKLSEGLQKAGGSGSNTLQDSKSVSSTVSGGVLKPESAGYGASALGSADAARQQLAQSLILAAMQGKGRSRGGQGLLG